MIGNINNGNGFRGCLDYVFRDDSGAELLGGNMVGEHPRELAHEFGKIRALREDIAKPVWHIALSGAEGEFLSEEKWRQIAERYLTGMKVDVNNHQYVVVRHKDKDHDHVHLIVNRIGVNGKVYHNRQDRYKSKQLLRVIEREHGLVPMIEKSKEKTREQVQEQTYERSR